MLHADSCITSEKQEASSSCMMRSVTIPSAKHQPELLLIHFGINLKLPVAHLKLGALRHAPGVLHFAFGYNLAFLWHQTRALSAAHGREQHKKSEEEKEKERE